MIKRGLLLSSPFLIAIAFTSTLGWINTPPGVEIPVHWDIHGQPDRYGGRLEAFILTPAIAVVLSILFSVAPSIDPRGNNLKRSSPAWLTVWVGVMAILAMIQIGLTLTAIGILTEDSAITLPSFLAAGIAILFILLGNVLTKARPNWFFGIRTPWTLSSDKAWDVTHRWGGRLYILTGLACLISVFLLPLAGTFYILIGGILGSTACLVVLSFLVLHFQVLLYGVCREYDCDNADDIKQCVHRGSLCW